MKSFLLITVCTIMALPFIKIQKSSHRLETGKADSIMCIGRCAINKYNTAYEQEKSLLLDRLSYMGNPNCVVFVENRQYRIAPIKVEEVRFPRCETNNSLSICK